MRKCSLICHIYFVAVYSFENKNEFSFATFRNLVLCYQVHFFLFKAEVCNFYVKIPSASSVQPENYKHSGAINSFPASVKKKSHQHF